MSLYNRVVKPLFDPIILVTKERDVFLEKIINEFGEEARNEAMSVWYDKFKEYYKPYQLENLNRKDMATLKFNANQIVIKIYKTLRLYEDDEQLPNIRMVNPYDNRRPLRPERMPGSINEI